MSTDSRTPTFKAQFDEIARLEAALRSGELSGPAASAALRRLYELMDWQTGDESSSDVDYLFA